MTPSAAPTARRRWVYRVLIILLVLLVPLLGYGIFKSWQLAQLMKRVFASVGTTTIVWDEEVKLHDGRVILIKRREATGGGGFPINTMNKRGLTKYYEFCYPEMGVYWKSRGGPSYHPEILDIVDGKVYVMVPVTGSETCMFHDYPATNAIYYVWEGGAWKKIPYEQFPKEVRRTNLLQNPWGKKPEDDARGLVTQSEKERRDGIYGAMRRTKGRIQNSTDYPFMQGACERLRGGVKTNRSLEVFLPATPDLCQLPDQGGNTP